MGASLKKFQLSREKTFTISTFYTNIDTKPFQFWSINESLHHRPLTQQLSIFTLPSKKFKCCTLTKFVGIHFQRILRCFELLGRSVSFTWLNRIKDHMGENWNIVFLWTWPLSIWQFNRFQLFNQKFQRIKWKINHYHFDVNIIPS